MGCGRTASSRGQQERRGAGSAETAGKGNPSASFHLCDLCALARSAFLLPKSRERHRLPYGRAPGCPRVRPSQGALLAVASAVAYGSLGVFARLAYGEGWNVPSLLVARWLFAALFILPFALAEGGSWRGFGGGFLLGAFGYAATTGLFFPSMRYLPVALASFLLYLAPIFVAILSWFLFRERLGWRGTISLALALLGLALLAAGAFTGELSLLGVLLASASAVTYAVSVVVSRRVVRGISWKRASLAVCTGALCSYVVFSVATGQLAVPRSVPGIVYAVGLGVLATGVALSLFFAALARLGASRTAVILTLEPVSTLVLAAVFIAEVPTRTGVLGGLLIVAGAALVASAQDDETVAAPHE